MRLPRAIRKPPHHTNFFGVRITSAPAARTSPLVIERSYGISRAATPQQPAGALRSRRCSVRNRCSSPITALLVLAPVLALTLLVLALTLLVLALTLLVLALTLLVVALILLVVALILL